MKNNKNLVATILRLVAKIETLHAAHVELPYRSFSIYGSTNYLSCDFTFGEHTFKMKDGEEVDWDTLNLIEKAVDDIKDAAVKEMEESLSTLELFKEA